MSEQLLPCPFCGDRGAYVADNGGRDHYVLCICGAEGPWHESERQAISSWNHRATQPQAPQGTATQKWHAPGIGEVHHEDHKFIVYCSGITDDEEIVDDVLASRICALLNAAPETPEGQKP